MVVKDETVKSFGLRRLIIYRESSPLGSISPDRFDEISHHEMVYLTPRHHGK